MHARNARDCEALVSVQIAQCKACVHLLGSRFRESCICSRLFLNAVIRSRRLFFSCSDLQTALLSLYCFLEFSAHVDGACTTYIDAHSGDSSKSAKISRDVPRVASLRLAAADILDASGPPLGCLRLRSCTSRKHLPQTANINLCWPASEDNQCLTCTLLKTSLARLVASS